jgi:MYXO-CTERM domain-containing protein
MKSSLSPLPLFQRPRARRLVPARLLAAGLLAAAALVPAHASAVTQNYCGFSTTAPWTYNQNAFEADQTTIRLTNAVASEAGSAWQTTPVPITATTPLHAFFRFQISPNATGGDGLAFVLHNSAQGAAAIGATAAGDMGFVGITPSVIVSFDTYKNGATDPSANFVGLELNGAAAHTATGTPTFTMANGGELSAWVDYDPLGLTISVYLSQTTTKPGTPVLTHALNLFTQLGAQMYIGFTSGTGLGTTTPPEINEHDVYELEYSTSGIPCSCEGDPACSGATPACLASGVCGVCSATNSTACTGATPICDVPTATCVGCLTNANCSGAKPICNAGTLTCRACTSNADCSGNTPVCDTMAGSANLGTCVVCTADASCPPSTPRCNQTSNACVQCLSNGDCGGDSPICKANKCEACASDADCTGTPATPACEVWGACGQCSSTNATACTGNTTICDFPSGTCVGCEFNSDCAGDTPTCDTASHMCRACASNADCVGNPGGPACVTSGMKAGSCVICQADADCTSPAAPKCDVTANLCVACLTNADCSGSTPVCNTTSNLCVGCLSNTDCSGSTPLCNPASSTCAACQNDYASTNPGPLACPTAALPACQPAGTTLAGTCATCSSLNNSVCVTEPPTPVCIAAQATCGCAQDADCAADNYCDTSTVTTGTCTVGCRVVNGTTNCKTGEYCTKTDGSVGTCMTEPCNSNTDCSGSTPVCNTIVQPHVCVQCLNNPDCSGSTPVCDTTTNHCVQCTAMQTSACLATGPGSACIASSETCGCAMDSDCGGAGRVCNTSTNTCQSGCRGSGGNGCPPGETCSSSDNTIGMCEAASTSSSSSSSSSSSGAGGADAGATTGGGKTTIESAGCGCRTAPSDDPARDSTRVAGLVALAAALGCARRRKRDRAHRSRRAD